MSPLLSVLRRVDRGLGAVEWTVAVLCMVVIVVSTSLGVFLRSLFDNPLSWANDLSVLGLLWLTFIGASALYKERGHIAVDALVQLLPGPARRAIATALVVMAGIAIAVTGWEMLVLVKLQHTKSIPSLGLPRSVNGIAVLWMSASMTLSSLRQVLETAAPPARAG